MCKKDQENKIARETLGKDGVIITYYVESPTVRSQETKLKPNPFPKKGQATSKSGYDRRAELLAYSNELRAADPQEKQFPRRSKPNKWKWSITPATLRVLSIRIFQGRKGQWRYKRMDVEEDNEFDRQRGYSCTNNMNKKNIGGSSFNFCNKLKCMLKELSGYRCYKGC